ncbi:lipopolysaccharide biosynthesis protein [Acidiluteibacter ferrifornacis]|uniref:Oligosaccharide flippase family protein n=1 Tax=Acidiluteibacter ferrifornacis TaxID=2692424 RepID=A0A6N9NL80_9FLAO|nr:lipopolysaccharide biosynthesis protein [Acidiluteibacter ferrifornacis]NBG66644.1 oligosaccharide flippase family protein [Acidiluteibacter ferrifornacis]
MSSLKRRSAIAVAWDLGGVLLNHGTSFIISIFLARLLSPKEFGLVGMAMVFITISQVFVDVGFSSALIQNKRNSNLGYNSVFYFNIVAGLLLTILFFFLAPFIGLFYENNTVSNLVRWLSLSILISSFNQVQSAILSRKLDFKALALRHVIASVVGGIVGVLAAFNGAGVYALVLKSLLASFLSSVLLWKASKWRPSLQFSLDELKKMMGFSSYVFFDRIVTTILGSLDVLTVAKVFSASTLGFYSRAVTLKDQVTTYSTVSIQKVFFPVLSSLQENEAEYQRIYFRIISVVAFVSYGLTGVLYILGEPIIIGLFGEKWGASVAIFQVLILSACNTPLNAMMINAFMSKGLTKENFKIGLFRKAVQLIPILIAYYYGLYAFTVSVVIVSYLITFTNILFLSHYLQLSISKHLLKVFEGMFPLLLFIAIIKFIGLDGLCIKLIFALLFGIFYCAYSYVLKSEGFVFVQQNILNGVSKWILKRK